MRLNQFWSDLAASQSASLLLDYDGTLAPFRVERNQATPYPGVREKLAAIRAETRTRLVIISGRAIDDLLPLLGLDPPPEVWGCHGWERLTADGSRPELTLPELAQAGLDKGRCWLEEQDMMELCETKPASLALHWRGRPAEKVKELHARLLAFWQPLAAEHQLEVHTFNGGLELRCPGRSKATAIESILAETEEGAAVAFLGDDLTDEDGFKALKGRGLSVLVSGEVRQTQADLRITPPEGLFGFLDQWYSNAPRSVREDERRG
jgi:trehalose 6-phosphate phosphatase